MRHALAVLLASTLGCGGDDKKEANPNPPREPICVTPSGALPQRWELPAPGNNGVFDPSVVRDPATGRYWVSYSSVQREPSGDDHVSTLLAYSDDGLTWCGSGTPINAASSVSSPPADVIGDDVHWSHEVSELVYDPGAPPAERWKLVWMRYITADTARRFEYGWLAMRTAATPQELAEAPERKWLAAAAYAATTAIETYNDSVGGPPEHELWTLGSGLEECAVAGEPALLATSDELYLAFLCATGTYATTRLELVVLSHPAETWSYIGRLLEADDGDQINAVIDGFSAPELFVEGGQTYLVATPHVADTYRGCIGYALDLTTGALTDTTPADGYPDPLFSTVGETFFNGACGYEPTLAAGLLLSQNHNGELPEFRIFATGVGP